MVFSSLMFLTIFLPVTLGVYYIVPRKYKNAVLFIFSLIFYGFGEPIYISLMIFSTVLDYTLGLLIEKNRGNLKKARIFLLISIVVNLSLLGFFKYSDFLIGNLNELFNLNIALLKLPLPIGISFYTFQTMSYTIDVYRGDVTAEKNIISFGAYVSLFPQLIAGPIVRYKTVQEELGNRRENIDLFSSGIEKFSIGLFKKVILANNIGLLWTEISSKAFGELSVLSAWLGIIAFGFQVYFDFSGYSDMAIGLGRIFGFKFLENFNYPYISKSITEFWRRWHISLGTWFREYVYIPLGGNRGGKIKFFRNIFIVWFLTGVWHGANWNYIYWGLYFGFILVLEKGFILKFLDKCPRIICHIYTLFLLAIGWVIFSFENTNTLFMYLKAMFGFLDIPFWNWEVIYYIKTNFLLLVMLLLGSTPIMSRAFYYIKNKNTFTYGVMNNLGIMCILFICIAYLVDATYNPFLYFRF